jgi:cephalosporin-C deacetylase-like acetyl esterase
VLTYDPIGQGERLQYYDPDLRASKVGGPTEEHSHANGHTMLVGDNVSRYRIWDGMRGIDYLLTRKDVDANRIGCTGCSGGGTLTTYISVLDDRVKVSAPACYITSWEALFNGPGPQDAEQVLPGFVANGLDFGDYVEAFAPKPWLIASTSEDFFPLAGAKQTFEEARRIYGVMGAEDRVAWFVGPGGHGVPKPSREAIYAWFIKWLKNGEGDAKEGELDPDLPDELLCTPTGQVADSLHGESVWSLNRKRADGIARTNPVLASAIRAVTLTTLNPGGAPPEMKVLDTAARTGYRLQTVSFETVPGVGVTGLLAVPEGDARKPAAVLADPRPKAVAGAPGGDLDQLARAGYVVFSFQPRGVADTAPATGRQQQSFVSGQGLFALASVVGRTLVGMRIEDIIRATDYLASRPDVDRAKIIGGGRGILGVPMLHAAVLDSRLRQTVLQETLESYRAVVDRPVHRNIYETGLYGVLRSYDLPDLEQALAAKRPVTVLNPVDPLGLPVRGKRTRATLYSSLTVR